MTTISKAGGLALLLAVAAPGLAQEGDAARGEASAAVCLACHQADGMGMNIPGGESWPRLAGMNADYLVKQLHDFKSGNRENMSMLPFANMLNDEQIADVAAYYSQMEPTEAAGGDVDEEVLMRGEQLAQRGDWDEYIVSCKSCHGPGNQGVGAIFPGIAGQQAGYIEDQLHAWQNGTRSNDPQDLMVSIAQRMSDEDIHAVAAWLATQPAGNE
ncbi:MAG: c-type cytochrome [Halomonas sp.]|uniref:c-type cytochrome n=1 Tax=Halomonas sp. TaxID=1486246 RepID=UPI003F8E724C